MNFLFCLLLIFVIIFVISEARNIENQKLLKEVKKLNKLDLRARRGTYTFSPIRRRRMNVKYAHFNCRNKYYKGISNTVKRTQVPHLKVDWRIKWPEYRPVIFTDKAIKSQSWADPELRRDCAIKFNSFDYPVSRVSFLGQYEIVNFHPLNPVGRTGLRGRGVLGRWGPNHSILAAVTRWKPFEQLNQTNTKAGKIKRTLQFVGVQYLVDSQFYWGFPTDFIKHGENLIVASKRVFLEKATDFLKANTTRKQYLSNVINSNMINSRTIYKGYHDSNRNTDNAWIEVTVKHFHDHNLRNFQLAGSDGLLEVKWIDINKNLLLSPTVKYIVKRIISMMECNY